MKDNGKKNKLSKRTKNDIQSYIMLSPQIIGFLLFSIFPLIWAIRLSWFSYNGIAEQTRFVGWENFVTLMSDTSYWSSLANTFLFFLMKLPLEIPLAMFLAVLLSKKLRGAGFFRAMYYMPHVISVAITALVFTNMFSYFGFINGWLQNLHISELPIEWFGTKFKAMFVLVLADTWRSFGVNVMYFMAAIQNVPEDVYEAAKIDGAGKLTTFFRITLPLIAPVMQVILMMSVIGTLGTNELVLVLTNGAPGGTTHTVKSYIFQNYAPGMADMNVNIGYGCAMSLVTGLILAAITLTYMKFSEKMKSIY